MSLKLFHVVFVAAALVLALWTGVWALGEGGALWLAVCCFVAAAGLVVYGVWFLRKMRGVSYL